MAETAPLRELAERIVSGLHLEDVKPEDIRPDQPLFGPDGIGLDSIDALELAVLVERHYGVRIEDMEKGKAAFASLQALHDFIAANKPA